jgi:hypothetical protein
MGVVSNKLKKNGRSQQRGQHNCDPSFSSINRFAVHVASPILLLLLRGPGQSVLPYYAFSQFFYLQFDKWLLFPPFLIKNQRPLRRSRSLKLPGLCYY